MDTLAWFSQHPLALIWGSAGCLSVSSTLIIRMWYLYRRASFLKKGLWTIGLLVPFAGWIFYAAFFEMPGHNPNQCHDTSGAHSGAGVV